jgi:hypothetical protein
LVQAPHLLVDAAGGDPPVEDALALRVEDQRRADRRVDGALGDGVPGQDAVLGVAPRPLEALDLLGAARERPHAAPPRFAQVHEQVAAGLVVDHALGRRVVERRVADLGGVEVEVLAEEEANLAPPRGEVRDHDAPQVDVLVEVHRVGALEFEFHPRVAADDVGDQGFRLVAEVDLPVGAHPGELAVAPDAEARDGALVVVLLADVGVVDVGHAVVAVEGDEQVPVADGDVARHRRAPDPR